MRTFITLITAAVFATAACTGSKEIDSKPAAQVQDVPSADASASVAAAPEPAAPAAMTPGPMPKDGVTYEAVVGESKITFLGAKITGTHDGGFTDFTGNAVASEDGVPLYTSFTIKTDSVWSDNEKLTGHLKSPDFFDVAKYPTATFTATDFTPKGGDNYDITGMFDLHGIKKLITFPAKVAFTATGAKVDAEFKIKRFDWNIVYPGKPDDLIKDEVAIKLDMVFAKTGSDTAAE